MRARKLFEATDDLTNSKKHVGALILLRKHAPVHYSTLIATDTVWTTKIPTAATDGVYVYINPDFYRGLDTDSQRAFLLAHEVSHVIRQHPQRALVFQKNGFCGKAFQPDVYNRAGDYLINDDGIKMGLEPIPCGLYSDEFTRDDLIESVYSQLVQDNQDGDQPDDQDDDQGDDQGDEQEGDQGAGSDASDGSDSDDSQDQGGDQGSSDNDSESGSDELSGHGGHDIHLTPEYDGTPEEQAAAATEDSHEIARAVDHGIEQAQEASIEVPKSILNSSFKYSEGHASDTDWRAELADLLTKPAMRGEATWSRIHRRRYATLGVVSPSYKGSLNRIANIIDVSSSVDRGVLNQFMVEQAALIDQLQPAEGVIVVFTNHQVVGVHEVHSGAELLDLDVPNGGGTRMSAGIEYLDYTGLECDVTLVFTDGELYGNDWEGLGDAVVVSDRQLDAYNQRNADAAGVRVINAAA